MTTAQLIARKLTARKLTLALAESCTGGLIAKTLTDIPGSSAFFVAGFITYANEAKINILKVPPSLMQRHGAVSAPVAKAMATGARQVTGADFSLAVTGIAGPTGGTPKKPVGLVFIAISSSRKAKVNRFMFKGTRQQVRTQAAQAALQMLLRNLHSPGS